eukprot:TRINITY_DN52306_c0_g1_i1.p1 TRINITY_DN52306_c0_g1~~TRINITY_DN52306_c0_g1_i1.p1  ORF type:complete len:161 (+),score=61.23 TRINITY_DN52306_c0_g1_i1:64-483(+)
MPLAKGPGGGTRLVHHGYEGKKYKILGETKGSPLVNWRRVGKWVVGSFLFCLVYFKCVIQLEKRDTEAWRQMRAKQIRDMEQQRPELFHKALDRGMIGNMGDGARLAVSVDPTDVLRQAFPEDADSVVLGGSRPLGGER